MCGMWCMCVCVLFKFGPGGGSYWSSQYAAVRSDAARALRGDPFNARAVYLIAKTAYKAMSNISVARQNLEYCLSFAPDDPGCSRELRKMRRLDDACGGVWCQGRVRVRSGSESTTPVVVLGSGQG